MSRFDWTPLLAAVGILRYHKLDVCVGGEAAFAYYNALFLDYDAGDGPVFEIIVPDDSYAAAPGLLCSTGLFTPIDAPDSTDFDGGWRSSNNFPHLATTGWNTSPSPVAIVPDVRVAIYLDRRICSLVNLADCISDFGHSPDLEGLDRDEIRFLPWPRLPALVRSLPWRMGHAVCDDEANRTAGGDDDDEGENGVSELDRKKAKESLCDAIADLVDGMDISTGWAWTYLGVQNRELCELVRKIIAGKKQRIWDAELDHDVTRGIRDRLQLDTIRSIPGRN
ncbi:hypothetical protein HRG_001244 [Hirsutella rhossiliensis]|uniref:Uncharacterized protein n=1 Tax=Hirsutella rhossiliensis TaxID=111463 RepID=A0A9P8N8Q9_9HYPO|nr:uncharacterized protein HRG_01244 [Hirsutella rhossiliensis]KAH0968602.1 hypothetical protein HRG_01244 [Hirsutella rhossiliensis]